MKPYSIYERKGLTIVHVHALREVEMTADGGIVAEPNGELADMEFVCVNEAALKETLMWLAEKGYQS